MADIVKMAKQGITVESCILGSWKVKVGDSVKVGDELYTYETDKAAFTEESAFEGEVLAIYFNEGDVVPVLEAVCAIGAHGEKAEGTVAKVKEAPQTAVKEEKTIVVEQPAITAERATGVTPRARALAEKQGVSLDGVQPTGVKGRIVEADIIRASYENRYARGEEKKVAESVDVRAYKDEKMPNIRKIIAKSMSESLATMAQLTHSTSFDATSIIQLRAYLKQNAEALNLPNITLNDMVVFAVSRLLKKHRALNAHLLNGDTMRYFESVNMGVAVDTPRGLLVPTLFGADSMSLAEIAVNAKKLAKDAVAGNINPELLSGGTFTISNLGSLGVEHFTPVINPPQTGILGVNCLDTKVRVGKNGAIEAYQAMGLSLTYDHRALDGAPASRFLHELALYLTDFSYNLLSDEKGLR